MSLQDDIEHLRQVELFSWFDDEQLRLLAFGSQRLSFPAGMELFHDGQMADGGFLVLSGKVAMETHGPNGSGRHKVFGPGSLIGETALITRTRRPGLATIAEDTDVIKIKRETVQRVLSEYPDLAAKLYQRTANAVVSMGKELEQIEKRLARDE